MGSKVNQPQTSALTSDPTVSNPASHDLGQHGDLRGKGAAEIHHDKDPLKELKKLGFEKLTSISAEEANVIVLRTCRAGIKEAAYHAFEPNAAVGAIFPSSVDGAVSKFFPRESKLPHNNPERQALEQEITFAAALLRKHEIWLNPNDRGMANTVLAVDAEFKGQIRIENSAVREKVARYLEEQVDKGHVKEAHRQLEERAFTLHRGDVLKIGSTPEFVANHGDAVSVNYMSLKYKHEVSAVLADVVKAQTEAVHEEQRQTARKEVRERAHEKNRESAIYEKFGDKYLLDTELLADYARKYSKTLNDPAAPRKQLEIRDNLAHEIDKINKNRTEHPQTLADKIDKAAMLDDLQIAALMLRDKNQVAQGRVLAVAKEPHVGIDREVAKQAAIDAVASQRRPEVVATPSATVTPVYSSVPAPAGSGNAAPDLIYSPPKPVQYDTRESTHVVAPPQQVSRVDLRESNSPSAPIEDPRKAALRVEPTATFSLGTDEVTTVKDKTLREIIRALYRDTYVTDRDLNEVIDHAQQYLDAANKWSQKYEKLDHSSDKNVASKKEALLKHAVTERAEIVADLEKGLHANSDMKLIIESDIKNIAYLLKTKTVPTEMAEQALLDGKDSERGHAASVWEKMKHGGKFTLGPGQFLHLGKDKHEE